MGNDRLCLLDTARGTAKAVFDFSTISRGGWPQLMRMTRGGKRLFITDYFLNEDDFGKVHAEGDHKVHVATVTKDALVLDGKSRLDMNTATATGPARPHGVAMK